MTIKTKYGSYDDSTRAGLVVNIHDGTERHQEGHPGAYFALRNQLHNGDMRQATIRLGKDDAVDLARKILQTVAPELLAPALPEPEPIKARDWVKRNPTQLAQELPVPLHIAEKLEAERFLVTKVQGDAVQVKTQAGTFVHFSLDRIERADAPPLGSLVGWHFQSADNPDLVVRILGPAPSTHNRDYAEAVDVDGRTRRIYNSSVDNWWVPVQVKVEPAREETWTVIE